MRYSELDEYNKGELGKTPENIIRNQLNNATPVWTLGKDTVFYYDNYPDAWYILATADKSEIKGYVWIRLVKDNIWKVMSSEVKTPGKGIGTELYHFIIGVGNHNKNLPKRSLIHDTQLSPAAEKLWKEKLPNRGLNFFIYDKKLNKKYDLADIGKKTSDGVEILDPEKDFIDLQINPTADLETDIRFFWLAESVNTTLTQYPIHPLKQKIIEGIITDGEWEEVIDICSGRKSRIVNGINYPTSFQYYSGNPSFSRDGEY
ncbi:MAG: hypothetical protein HC836_40650 [Richelia sp. RM2_1_2]|nr:hypothetical protein [Richelia sp. RM2_1_2]